jgi:hypothetical protein
MRASRQSRFVAALIVLFSMLFMQLAVASYACPNMRTGPADMASAAHAMPGCTGMDMEQPSLCHAQDQVGNQSLDKPNLPQVQPFVAVGLMQALVSIEAAYRPVPAQPRALVLARATAPPLAIRNCCFRI